MLSDFSGTNFNCNNTSVTDRNISIALHIKYASDPNLMPQFPVPAVLSAANEHSTALDNDFCHHSLRASKMLNAATVIATTGIFKIDNAL